MTYTREQTNRLICQYQPAILYRGKVYELQHPPLLADTVLRLEIYPFEYINAPLSECRMMLRPVGGMDAAEQKELAVLLFKRPYNVVIHWYEPDSKYVLRFDAKVDGVKEVHFWRPLDNTLPLNIADYLFSKDINFLNLPAEICTEQIK